MSRRRPRSLARDRTVKRVQAIGRRRWKKETGYHWQARVENVFMLALSEDEAQRVAEQASGPSTIKVIFVDAKAPQADADAEADS